MKNSNIFNIDYAKTNTKLFGIFAFYGHYQYQPGRIDKACLSNWYPIQFKDDENTVFYNTEQYMMYHKALTMGDHISAESILNESNPGKIKQLGRKVKNFDPKKWDDVKLQIMIDGLLLKFGQNPPLKTFLTGTRNRILVEAAPNDHIWGVRMNANDPRINYPEQWEGENLLGFALMEARYQILKK